MNNLGLYLHFPFCRAKCRYCDFYSLPDLSLVSRYEAALVKSLSDFSSFAEGYFVDSIYFGGGTPSLASEEGIRGIFAQMRASYRILPDCEITVEMNPESASPEVLAAFYREGARRLSFGMQSAKDEELSLLGRLHTAKETELAIKRAREAGFENVSLDLMFGLPDQTKADFRYSLEKAISLSPKHISFYLLTLSEEVPLFQQIEKIPEEEVLREMYLDASEFLLQNGFEHYEISNAALPGFRSRHNERYWKREPYLGFGPGAHSYFGRHRFSIRNSLSDFLSFDSQQLVENREEITPEEEILETIMLSLRRKEGLDLSHLSDPSVSDRAREKMIVWEKNGLCRKTENGFALTPEGFFVSNQIISELI